MGKWVLAALLSCAAAAACAVASTSDDGGGLDTGVPPDSSVGKDSTSGKDASTSDTATDTSSNDVASDAPVDTGVTGAASLQVNEVAPNITGSMDLVELLVLAGGDISGITVEQDITTKVVLATLPTLVVTTGDFIVVHLNAPAGVTTETTTKADCTNAACYSGAWDVVGAATGITYSGRVLLARGPDAGIEDGVAFYNSGAVSPAAFHLQVEALQDAGQWLPVNCGGNPCSTNALAQAISANWVGAGTTTAKSVARKANVDTDKLADWAVGTSSFGATNP